MERITTRDLIRTVAKRWREQYPKGCDDDKEKVCFILRGIDLDTVKASVIEGIIGNNSWTTLECGECQEPTGVVVSVSEYDDEIKLCAGCIAKASKLIKGAK